MVLCLTHCLLPASERGITVLPSIKGLTYWLWAKKLKWNDDGNRHQVQRLLLGGRRRASLTYAILKPYLNPQVFDIGPHLVFDFVDHVADCSLDQYECESRYLIINMPVHVLIEYVAIATARQIVSMHDIQMGS